MVKDRAFQPTLPMSGGSRGIVVAFPARRPDSHQTPSGVAERAKKPVTCLVRLCESRDVVLNADWDRLISLVVDAWSWCDPDCVAAVEACIAYLRRSVDDDWS
jgi:hypothetical protein